jgi:hypothetical protein
VRNLVAVLSSIIALVALNLLAQVIFPTIQYQSGNHEIATTIALGGAFLTGAIVYSLYPRFTEGGKRR